MKRPQPSETFDCPDQTHSYIIVCRVSRKNTINSNIYGTWEWPTDLLPFRVRAVIANRTKTSVGVRLISTRDRETGRFPRQKDIDFFLLQSMCKREVWRDLKWFLSDGTKGLRRRTERGERWNSQQARAVILYLLIPLLFQAICLDPFWSNTRRFLRNTSLKLLQISSLYGTYVEPAFVNWRDTSSCVLCFIFLFFFGRRTHKRTMQILPSCISYVAYLVTRYTAIYVAAYVRAEIYCACTRPRCIRKRAILDRALARTSYATTERNFIIKVTSLHLVSSITRTMARPVRISSGIYELTF